MPIRAGEDFILRVETVTPGTFVTVNDLNSYSKSKAKNRSRYPVFGGTVHTITTTGDEDYTFSGFLNDTDPGQQRLRDVANSETPVLIQVFVGGGTTNGFQQLVRVHTYTHDADPEGLQEHGFECTAVATATVLGTGVVI